MIDSLNSRQFSDCLLSANDEIGSAIRPFYTIQEFKDEVREREEIEEDHIRGDFQQEMEYVHEPFDSQEQFDESQI